MTSEDLTAQNSSLWDTWLDKYVKRLTADIADVTDVRAADCSRQRVMNATNPRCVFFSFYILFALLC